MMSQQEGAQRLSASLESSRLVVGLRRRARRDVLNAFRHHWNLHYTELLRRRDEKQCSTPFGIIGIFTDSENKSIRVAYVLNAFRHHWNLHGCNEMPEESFKLCSTPFGIIGIFTS